MNSKLPYFACALALFFLSVSIVMSQSLEWVRRGGSPNHSDYAQTIQLDQEGNIYVGGYFNHIGRFDTLNADQGGVVIKLDRDGKMMWGRSIPEFDVYDIAIDSRNGVLYVVGYRSTRYDWLLIKYTLDGERLWLQRLPETWTNGSQWVAGSVTVDADGDVYVGGALGASPHLSKFSASGEALWHQTFGPDNIWLSVLSSTFDDHGNLYVAISQDNYAGQSIQLIKIDPSEGDIIWQKDIVGSATAGEIVYDRRGHILMAGSFFDTLDFGGGTTLPSIGMSGFLARFDTSGVGLDVVRIAGYFEADGVAIDQHGDILVAGRAMQTLAIGDSVLPRFNDDALIVRFRENLQFSYYLTLGPATVSYGVAADNSGTYLIGQVRHDNPIFGDLPIDEEETGDFFIAKVGANSTLNVEERESPLQHIGLSPNPAWGSSRLEIPADMQVEQILIRDVTGRVVRTIEEEIAGSTAIDLHLEGIASGLYYVCIQSDGASTVVPLVRLAGE